MLIIIGGTVGVFIGMVLMGLLNNSKVEDLIFERDYYKTALQREKLKTEQRDILIRDLIKKESVTTTNQTTNS